MNNLPNYNDIQNIVESSPPVSSSAKADTKGDDASLFDALGNLFTGNLDYKRSIESAIRAEERSAYEAEKARKFSAKEAEKNRNFQAMMSNTAYSRAIADLKKAGINPYAIGAFSPSSTPAGAIASAYAGAGLVGNTFKTTADGFRLIADMIETAYKEKSETRRSILNIVPKLLESILEATGKQTNPIGFLS